VRLVAWIGVALGVVAIVRLAGSLDSSGTAPVSVATAPATPAPAAVQRPAYSKSVAVFAKDTLDECVDVDIDPAPGEEPTAVEKLKNFGSGSTVLTKRCAEQFADRQSLATCTINSKSKVGTLTVVERHYGLASVVDSDSDMQACLKSHGDWQTADARTLERARLGQAIRQADKMAAETP
jgi:hypothetical protein